jgi:hypothetical protein
LGIGILPSMASAATTVSASTTGASGRAVYISNGSWRLYATDTLTDGHCAQWQSRLHGSTGSWSWTGDSSCSGSEEAVGYAYYTYDYRICRTGVGNCSSALDL